MTTYRVIGTCIVRHTVPGGLFEADLTDFEEATLIEAGHIERVTTHRFRPGTFTEEPLLPTTDDERS